MAHAPQPQDAHVHRAISQLPSTTVHLLKCPGRLSCRPAADMLALRRGAAASRLLAHCEPLSSSSKSGVLQQPLEQRAGYAKKGGESVDSRLQKVLKMLEPRQVEEVQLSPEDHAEAMRRCGGQAVAVERRLREGALLCSPACLRGVACPCCVWSLPCAGCRPTCCNLRARRAKDYSRRRMQAHRAWQADLTAKLKLKQAAVAALPPHLRAAAEVPDDEPFPLNREMWSDTPPIEGFGQGVGSVVEKVGASKMGTKHR